MSLIFSGLPRLNAEDSEGPDISVNLQNPFQLQVEANGRKIFVCIEGTTSLSDISLFTKNQKFCIYAQKKHILDNVVHFVPRVFYLFKIDYAVQIAIRYMVKMLSGTEDSNHINSIISANPGINEYFVNFLEIVEYVYKGNLIKSYLSNEAFNTQILSSLVEVIEINRNESFNHPMLMPQKLRLLGDNNQIFSQNTLNDNVKRPDWVGERGKQREICMISCNFICILCKDIYDSNIELKLHIANHDDFSCLSCKLKFGNYAELLSHKLTFCRATVLLDNCEICSQPGKICDCANYQNLIVAAIVKLQGQQSECPIFENRLFSMIFHYCCEKVSLKFLKTHPITEDVDDQEKWDENSVVNLIHDSIPCFEISNLGISCKALDMKEIKWSIIKNRFKPYFAEFSQVIDYQIGVLDLSLNICLYNNCTTKFSVEHCKTHLVCPFARDFDNDELCMMFRDEKHVYAHLIRHKLNYNEQLSCLQCFTKVGDEKGEVMLQQLFSHGEIHELDDHPYPNKCRAIRCNDVDFNSLLKYVIHQMLHHAFKPNHIFSYIELLFGFNKSQAAVVNDPSIESDPILSSRPQLRTQRRLFSEFDAIHKNENNAQKAIKVESLERNSNKIYCENENHILKPQFSSLVEKKRHIINEHSCPISKCSYFTEYDSELLDHLKIAHDNRYDYCNICKQRVINMSEHENSHPICGSCRCRFVDLAALRQHEPGCTVILCAENQDSQLAINGLKKNSLSLNIDTNDVEVSFVETMNMLLDAAGLDNEVKQKSKECISKFAAETALTKGRSRGELISNRRSAELFFDVPCFVHSDRSNLQKILQTIGNVVEADKFAADSTSSIRDAVENFEKLDILVRKIDKLVQIGFLTEQQTMLVLALFMSQRVSDEITSFLGQTDLKTISFRACLQALQFVFVPLKLDTFLAIVLNYRINTRYETFLSFASRVTRHLTLCSRVRPEENRQTFLEMHKRSIFKQNLPSSLLDDIERKEKLFTEFSSKELLEITVSFLEHNEFSDETIKKNFEKYRVYTMRSVGNEEGLVRKPGNIEKKKYVKNKQVKKKIQQVTQPEIASKTLKTPTEASKIKLKILSDLGIKSDDVICFMCLGPHLRAKCGIYGSQIPYSNGNELCVQTVGNQKVAFGFHPRETCKHGNNARFGKQVVARAVSTQSTNNWRSYRK